MAARSYRKIWQLTRVLDRRSSATFFCWSSWVFKEVALSCKYHMMQMAEINFNIPTQLNFNS